jgi:hypothetical protein
MLHHIITHYDELAAVTIFTQGNPLHHSPDFVCLLNMVDLFAPMQPLAWLAHPCRAWPECVPAMESCNDAFMHGCKLYIEPMTSSFQPRGGKAKDNKSRHSGWMARRPVVETFGEQAAKESLAAIGLNRVTVDQLLDARRTAQGELRLFKGYGSLFAADRATLHRYSRDAYRTMYAWVTRAEENIWRGWLCKDIFGSQRDRAIIFECLFLLMYNFTPPVHKYCAFEEDIVL